MSGEWSWIFFELWAMHFDLRLQRFWLAIGRSMMLLGGRGGISRVIAGARHCDTMRKNMSNTM